MNRRVLGLAVLASGAVACPPPGPPGGEPSSVTEARLRVVKVHPAPFGGSPREMRWSPDGTRLAVSHRGLFVWDDPLQGAPRKLDDTGPDDFTWTADGRTLVFSRLRQGPRATSELFACEVASGTIRLLREEDGRRFFPLIGLQDSIVASFDRFDAVPSRPRFFDAAGRERSRPDALEFDLCWEAEDGIWGMRAGRDERVRIPIPGRIWTMTAPLHGGRIAAAVLVEQAVRYVAYDFAGRAGPAAPLGFEPGTWSRSGRFLIGCELADDGHRLIRGEIALWDTSNGEYALLTDTPGVLEYGVAWCEAAGRLAYADERTGDVILAVLEP